MGENNNDWIGVAILKKIIVIGAGIAGLAAAHKFVETAGAESAELDVLVLAKSARVGGTILTEKHEGFIIEGGPDCFLSEKPWALALASRLGIADRVSGTIDENKGTHIMWGSKLHPLPEGVMLMVPTRIMPMLTSSLLTWSGKLRMGLDVFIPRRSDGKDENLAEFVTRRLGRQALERIAEPLVAGVHAGDPETMSLSASFPRFKALEDKYGSLIRGMLAGMRSAKTSARSHTMFVTFEKGLADFTNAVAEAIGDQNIRLNTSVDSVERGPDGQWLVNTAGGETLEADAVIISTPAHVSSGITSKLDSGLSGELEKIPYVGTATVSMAFAARDVEGALHGFGFVVPRAEGRNIMAATYTSRKFAGRAPEGKALIRCFIGGIQRPDLVGREPDYLADIAADELRNILGIKADPIWAKAYSWPDSMPQAIVGHAERMKRIGKSLDKYPNIEIAGGAYEGLGIPDCIRVGEAAAQKILDKICS